MANVAAGQPAGCCLYAIRDAPLVARRLRGRGRQLGSTDDISAVRIPPVIGDTALRLRERDKAITVPEPQF